MVNSILKYIEPQLKDYMRFLNRVDSPVFRISDGQMIKGNGQEKEVVTISDLSGNSLYIRQTQPETITERKALSSCDKEWNVSARCKAVFYNFGGNDYTINPDKVKSKIINALSRLNFSQFVSSISEIKIDINGNSLDMEKIFTEETGKQFEGTTWPTLVSVDFTISYVNTNCGVCDIEDNDKDDDGDFIYIPCSTQKCDTFVVEIKDQDGNVLQTFNTSGEYMVTVLSGIQQVIGNTTTTITQDITN